MRITERQRERERAGRVHRQSLVGCCLYLKRASQKTRQKAYAKVIPPLSGGAAERGETGLVRQEASYNYAINLATLILANFFFFAVVVACNLSSYNNNSAASALSLAHTRASPCTLYLENWFRKQRLRQRRRSDNDNDYERQQRAR